MTALADIDLDSVALKTYKNELNPRRTGANNGQLSVSTLISDGEF